MDTVHLSSINYGYDDIEPIIISLIAQNKSFMLIGRHGIGKTRLVKFLSKGLGGVGFGFYDATKDDLITVAGIPDPEAMKKGDLRFLQHQRTIWNKTTVVVDEITRAGKESQNMWLEILEDHTCFGLPLVYQSLVATANPESYAAANRLDEALLDRFYAVVNAPEHQVDMTPEGVSRMFELNFTDTPETNKKLTERLVELFSSLRLEYRKMKQNPDVMSKVMKYCSSFASHLLNVQKQSDNPVFVSPRTYCRNFPEVLLCTAAYLKHKETPDFLKKAAVYAYKYALGTKLGIEMNILADIHNSFVSLLEGEEVDDISKVRVEIGELTDLEDKVKYCKTNALRLAQLLPADEVEKFVASIFKQIGQEHDTDKLLDLANAVKAIRDGHEELSRRIDGKLMISLNQAIVKVSPFLHHTLNTLSDKSKKDRDVKEGIKRFLSLCGHIEKLAVSEGEIEKLKRYILNVQDGDETLSEERVTEVFASVSPEDLPE